RRAPAPPMLELCPGLDFRILCGWRVGPVPGGGGGRGRADRPVWSVCAVVAGVAGLPWRDLGRLHPLQGVQASKISETRRNQHPAKPTNHLNRAAASSSRSPRRAPTPDAGQRPAEGDSTFGVLLIGL